MPKTKTENRFQVRATAADRAELILYGEIDRFWGVGAKQVRDDLKALDAKITTLDVHINSEGGSYFEGVAIYNVLRNHPARVVVHVDGMALSIASLIAMAGDERIMAEGAYLMVHNPVMAAFGDAADHAQTAELLKDVTAQLTAIYARHTGLPDAEIVALMDAETWLDADEAVAKGFATGKAAALAVAANFHANRFRNVPEVFTNHSPSDKEAIMPEPTTATPAPAAPQPASQPTTAPPAPQAAGYADLKAALPEADAGFMIEQLDAKATVDQARAAWGKHLADQVKARDEEIALLKAQATQAAAQPGKPASGVPPLASAAAPAAGPSGDPLAEWNARVEKAIRAGRPRHVAVREVAVRHPELRKAFVAAHNAGR